MRDNVEKKITILLVIKDRPEFSIRWLEYANQIKIPFDIFIADGSSCNNFSKKLDKSLFKDIKFRYKYFGFDDSPKTFYRKILSALYMITTDYIMLADDDDFLIPSSIISSAIFLESNPGYSACGSYYAGIFPKNNQIFYLKDYSLKTSSVPNRSYEQEDGLERIVDCFEDFRSIHYDLYRRDTILKAYKDLCHSSVDDLFLHEYFLAASYLAQGKLKKCNGISLVRQHENPLSSFSALSLMQDNDSQSNLELLKQKLPDFYKHLSLTVNIDKELLKEKLEASIVNIFLQGSAIKVQKSLKSRVFLYMRSPTALLTYLKAKFLVISINKNKSNIFNLFMPTYYKLKDIIRFFKNY
tara:strand:+ start:1917 stop:2981 length:1065 start_codon:yes stop_codon:yes gene_type:complete